MVSFWSPMQVFGVSVVKAVGIAIVADVFFGTGVSSFKGGPFFKWFFISN